MLKSTLQPGQLVETQDQPTVAQPEADRVSCPVILFLSGSEEMSPNSKVLVCRRTACVGLALTCLLSSAVTTFAQGTAMPAPERWQPKDGIYASPGKDFEGDCDEIHYIEIELADKSVSGNEWSCKITRRTDTAADSVRLDMTCYDYNLTQTLYPKDPNARERKVKEVMLLKRLDNGAISIRKTVNNKFKYPSWRADYCPERVQRTRLEGMAEAKLKAAQEEMMRNPWRPKVGVYAAPGANFSERCLNGGEATIDLSERSIAIGPDKCSVVQIRDELGTAETFVDCGTPKRSEIIIFRKLDDATATILVQKTKNRNFGDAGEQLSYCGAAAQATYAQGKSKK